jgi:hypothetical protein
MDNETNSGEKNELFTKKPQVLFTPSEYDRVKARLKEKNTQLSTFGRSVILRELGMLPTAESVFSDDKQIRGVSLRGTIHAGEPAECREEEQREIVCSEHPSGDSYSYLEIKGDCMDKQVPEGAFALFREQGYAFGQTVAVLIDCELMLRVYEYDPKYKCARLDPDSHNSDHKPFLISEVDPKSSRHIWIKPESALIRGVYTGDYIMKRKAK